MSDIKVFPGKKVVHPVNRQGAAPKTGDHKEQGKPPQDTVTISDEGKKEDQEGNSSKSFQENLEEQLDQTVEQEELADDQEHPPPGKDTVTISKKGREKASQDGQDGNLNKGFKENAEGDKAPNKKATYDGKGRMIKPVEKGRSYPVGSENGSSKENDDHQTIDLDG